MATKFILLITLIAYSVIVSQSFMYILALRSVSLRLNSNTYIEFRKQIDRSMRANFKYVVYSALLFNLLLVVVTITHAGSILFISSVISFVALVIDVVVTIKGNIPVNNVINTWTVNDHPTNWSDFRAMWLSYFRYRQIANIIGFLSLVAGAVFAESSW